MSISIDQWRVSIALFYGQVYGHFSIKLNRSCCNFKMVAFILCFYAVFAFLLLLKHGDVEINPRPKKKETRFFSCLHWNINSILTHSKLTLLEAYITIHQYILCISETYLNIFIQFQIMTLFFPSLPDLTLLGQIILTMLKGVVFVCITRKNYLWEWLTSFSFLGACYAKYLTLQS